MKSSSPTFPLCNCMVIAITLQFAASSALAKPDKEAMDSSLEPRLVKVPYTTIKDKNTVSSLRTESDYFGRLIYAFDTARYNASGFSSTWESFLVISHLDSSKKDKKKFSHVIESYLVQLSRSNFVFDPQFSPDSRYVTFKVGDPSNSDKPYQLYLTSGAGF